MGNPLRVVINGVGKYTVIFNNAREDRTLLVEAALKLGGTTFVRRKDGTLAIIGIVHHRYFRAYDRGALRYLEAAWRLGVLPKKTFDKYVALNDARDKRDRIASAASDAIEGARQAGVDLPAATRKQLAALVSGGR